jgi:2-oxoglutarate dehydrogenase E2 component (dihydrolipoamide succinyltransferase)
MDDVTRVPLSRLRKLIAQRMLQSLQTSAQLTTVVEADVSEVAALRARGKAEFERRVGVKLTFLPFFALAALEALVGYPAINASLDSAGEFVEYHNYQNLGVAVDTDRGLVVPVVGGAGGMSLASLAIRIDELASKARANRLGPDDVYGATFTITNTGSRGALFDTPIVNPPQAAILGTGAVTRRVVPSSADGAKDGIAIRSMVYLCLSYDHRLIDGAVAADFLRDIKSRLEGADFGDLARL